MKWSGNAKSFGLKLMTAQGWQPGDYLGAKNAKQVEHYTVGSASHIRVMIKEDNLGLGAKIGSGVGHGECTGLDAFKDLLGRLNGKYEDEVEKEKKSREDLKRAIYSERRWGSTRFVKGGFLIGDKIRPLIEAEAERLRKFAEHPSVTVQESSSISQADEQTAVVEKAKKSKKRKLEDYKHTAELVTVKVKKLKQDRKKSEHRTQEAGVTVDTLQDVKEPERKSKKDRKSEVEKDLVEEERRRRKQEKKETKARKTAEKLKSDQEEDVAKVDEKSKRESNSAELSGSSSRRITKESTSLISAPSSGYSIPMMQGRHAVRSRNIAQKRLASMDMTSLNQVGLLLYCDFRSTVSTNQYKIFMIKS